MNSNLLKCAEEMISADYLLGERNFTNLSNFITQRRIDMDELFKSRREVELLMLIIQEWQKDHPKDDKAIFSDEIYDKLDYIHMVW